MTISDFVMILAVLAAPVMAVQVQKKLETYRERRWHRLRIFKTLMATRGTTIAPNHVEALNAIDLEFDDPEKDKGVIIAWKEYLDHLNSGPNDKDPETRKQNLTHWSQKTPDYLANLLHTMGQRLGYHFDKVHIKKSIYYPQGHFEIEQEQLLIRRLLIAVLVGDRAIPMDVKSLPTSDELAEENKRVRLAMSELLEGKRALRVNMLNKDAEAR